MNESILVEIKKLLGIDEDDTSFDTDIIIHINSVLAILKQIGVTNIDFAVTGTSETWGDYLGTRIDLNTIKTYIYLKVKLLFDPPQNSSVIESLNRIINEFEWRINATADFSSSDQNT